MAAGHDIALHSVLGAIDWPELAINRVVVKDSDPVLPTSLPLGDMSAGVLAAIGAPEGPKRACGNPECTRRRASRDPGGSPRKR